MTSALGEKLPDVCVRLRRGECPRTCEQHGQECRCATAAHTAAWCHGMPPLQLCGPRRCNCKAALAVLLSRPAMHHQPAADPGREGAPCGLNRSCYGSLLCCDALPYLGGNTSVQVGWCAG